MFVPPKVMVPVPTLVKLKVLAPSVMTPLNVPEPVPPSELCAPKVIALLKVALVPEKVSAPALLTPVPLKLIPLVLPSVALLKLISKAVPLATEILLELLMALLAAKLKVPVMMPVDPV